MTRQEMGHEQDCNKDNERWRESDFFLSGD